MPVVLRVRDRKVESVVILRHIAPNDVCAEGSISIGWHELNIKLAPAIVRPFFSRVTFPEGEEGSTGTLLVVTLNFGDELTILVGLPSHDFT